MTKYKYAVTASLTKADAKANAGRYEMIGDYLLTSDTGVLIEALADGQVFYDFEDSDYEEGKVTILKQAGIKRNYSFAELEKTHCQVLESDSATVETRASFEGWLEDEANHSWAKPVYERLED